MLKKYLLICLVLPMLSLAQDKFSLLDKSSMETTILYDRAFKIANISDETQKIDASYFIQAYSELSKSDYSTNFQNITALKNASKVGFTNNYVPIGILNTKFDVLSQNAIENDFVRLDANTNVIKTSTAAHLPLFETHKRTFASPLSGKVRGLQTTFKVLPEFIINSTSDEIAAIQINFNDNNGFRTVNYNEDLIINYTSEGEKQLDFKILFNDGTIERNSAFITIQLSSADLNQRAALAPGDEGPITPINSTLTYQGFGEPTAHLGTAEYKIYYDNVDGVLDKPIFFVDGFDPDDSRTIPLMYDLLNFGNPVQNLADLVRDEGFDIVVLNFPTYTSASDNLTMINGGADFIQRNAYILVELINTINDLKVGNEENVVIGPSMGGLISRYALRYMEQNTMDHETRLYLSFDAPHLGANIPIGIQYLFNYMVNGDPGITAAEPLISGLLNSAAAKQMLIDHFSSHLSGADAFTQDPNITLPVGAANFRDAFQAELDAMGFPLNTRNVSMVNGSGLAATTGTPGMNLVNHTFDTGVVSGFNTQAIVSTNFTPAASQTITVTDFVGQAFIITSWVDMFSFQATAQSLAITDGLDSAPGGQFDMYSFDDGSNALITEFVANLNSQYFDFIPTLSALAITEPNWYTVPNTNSSPFVNTYIPDANEPHITLTDANVAFALSEILSPPLSVPTFENNTFTIEKNPISNTLTILSHDTFEDVSISIIDLTGKTVYTANTSLTERTSFVLNIASGMYILNINTIDGYNYNTKVFVK
jgi:hypothetical protein